MKTLRQIESIVFKTDCKNCILLGRYISQPILTMDDNGVLIDNYFTYGQDLEGSFYFVPFAVFGIYSDEGRTAYKKEYSDEEVKKYTIDTLIDSEESKKAFTRYEEIYPTVREWAYKKCNEEQKQIVKEYLKCLQVFSGSLLWKFYRELFPSFFEWAENLE